MAVDDEDGTQRPKAVQDYGIDVDFANVDDDGRKDGSAEMGPQLDASLAKLPAEIERMDMMATERLDDVEAKLADPVRGADKTTRDPFNDLKNRRYMREFFDRASLGESGVVDLQRGVLTKVIAAPMGAVAYFSIEDSEEPCLSGVKYHAMPPMKPTVAALALLFAIHSYQPASFFVLDGVDAALDNTNVARIANYIQRHASDSFQFIVISLKSPLYERGNSLVGIY